MRRPIKPTVTQKEAAMEMYSNGQDGLEVISNVPAPSASKTVDMSWVDKLAKEAGVFEAADGTHRVRKDEAAKLLATMEPIAAKLSSDEDVPVSEARAQLQSMNAVQKFLFAGHAIVTVVSKRTGTRFTFRFSQPKQARDPDNGKPTFVSVLTGPDNNASYTFLGTIFPRDKTKLVHSKKSPIQPDAKSARWARGFVESLADPTLLDRCEVFHAGFCGRCGRRLTVPESIESGYGPECAGLV